LVDDGAVPGYLHRMVTAPGECRVDDLALGHEGRAVALIETQIAVRMPDGVAEQRFGPTQLADQLLGIGVDQQLVGVEAMSCFRLVGAMYTVAIDLPGMGIRQI